MTAPCASGVRSQLQVNILSSLCTAALSIILIGFAWRVYLNFLGYEKYGLWLVLSTVLNLAQVGNFGIAPALVTLVARDFAAKDIEGVYQYIRSAIVLLLASGAILVMIVLLMRRTIISLFGITGPNAEIAYSLLPYVGILCAYYLIADAINSALAGLGRYDFVVYSQLMGQLVTVASAVLFFKLGFGIWSLLFANAVCAVFLNLAGLVLIRRITGFRSSFRFTGHSGHMRRILGFGSWIFGATILCSAMTPLNRLFVTRFAGIAAVPVYDISFATCMKIRSLFESGFRSLTPEFSNVSAMGPGDAYRRLAAVDAKGFKAALIGGTLAFLPVFLACGWGLNLWLGGRFNLQIPGILRIMLIGTYAGMWGLQPWYSLLGFGKSQHVMGGAVAQAAGNVLFVLGWPFATHSFPTLTTVAIGTSAGMLAATLYLRSQNARLKRDLAVLAGREPRSATESFRKDLART